jgi:NitT/TauT family transport system permease protein
MSQTSRDRLLLGVTALLLWQLSTAWLKLLDPQLFPEPLQVLRLLVEDRQVFLKSLVSSFTLLFWGCTLAALLAIPLGLIVGWNRRLRLAIEPATNVLGPIPPIVYIPYAIAILPTFTQSSIFIIFIGAFWPLFMNTIAGVEALEKGIVDSAKTIGVSKKSMLTKILLPGAMPHIVSGGAISMVLAFILLTAAEMIGATSGLGWYVKYFSDFADYPRVVAGIIVIGAVVLTIMTLYHRLTSYLLRWRK